MNDNKAQINLRDMIQMCKSTLDELDNNSLLSILRAQSKQFDKALTLIEKYLPTVENALDQNKADLGIKTATIFIIGLWSKLNQGASVSELTKDDWNSVLGAAAEKAVTINPQDYSRMVFDLYRKSIAYAIIPMRANASESVLNRLEEIVSLMDRYSEDFESGAMPEVKFIEENLWLSLEAVFLVMTDRMGHSLLLEERRELAEAVSALVFQRIRFSHYDKELAAIDECLEYQKKLDQKLTEEYIISKINKYAGKSDKELCTMFDRPYNNNKAQWIDLAYRMLGIKSNKAEEFEKAQIVVKAIRLEENGSMRENSPLPVLNFRELLEQEWEESTLFNYFNETRFLFVIYRKKGEVYILKGAQLWNMPYSDLNEIVHQGWSDIREVVSKGVIFTKVQQKNGIVIKNNLPKKNNNASTQLKNLNKHFTTLFGLEELVNRNHFIIQLEKFLQVLLSFKETPQNAVQNKNKLLVHGSKENETVVEFIKNPSLTSNDYLYLYLLYLKAEKAKRNSADGRMPNPFYLIYCFANYECDGDSNNISQKLASKEMIDSVVGKYTLAITQYYKKWIEKNEGKEYNDMIKAPMDKTLMDRSVDDAMDMIKMMQQMGKF